MNVAFFQTHGFEKQAFEQENKNFKHEITFLEPRLTEDTARLAEGHQAVCSFANDRVNRNAIEQLKEVGVQIIALRTAGFNHVDLDAAKDLGIPVVRVPGYSPYAVAEHAVALLLHLNRKLYRAGQRVRDLNFSLEGLTGFDLHGKTIGVIGTGRIGEAFCHIMKGFGCRVLAYDISPNQALKDEKVVEYVDLKTIYAKSDVISLHVPLLKETHHLLDEEAFRLMKKGVYLVNTSRGALVDSKALIEGLKSEHIGGACLDVYEEEESVFFQDLSHRVLKDDVLARLLTFPNVVITSHQGFLTQEAVSNIASTTLQNLTDFEKGRALENQVAA